MGRTGTQILVLLVFLSNFAQGGVKPDVYFESLDIIVPAVSGGGWDLTAQALKKALEQEGIVGNVQISRSPGAGGLVGLAQFLEGRRGDGKAILVSGSSTIAAETPNRANISLLDATSIARLTETGLTFIVPASSDIRNIEDLIVLMQSRPHTLKWTGGARGGPDEMLLHHLIKALRIDVNRVNYQAYPSVTEMVSSLFSGEADVGIKDYSELQDLIESGHIRALAFSTDRRLNNISVPTLKEVGIDIVMGNWRGVFAPPGIDLEQRNRLSRAFDAISESQVWLAHLDRHHWTSAYLTGDAFDAFLRTEYSVERIIPARTTTPSTVEHEYVLRFLWGRYSWVFVVLAVVLMLSSFAFWQRYSSHRKMVSLETELEAVSEFAYSESAKLKEALEGRMEHINLDFEKWGLSIAEKEISLLMLKGLRLQEIADMRNTSERTVRQQAQSIYRKSGLEGRTELSAYFIEDLINPLENG